MGWVWKDDLEGASSKDVAEFDNSSPGPWDRARASGGEDRCISTRKIVKSQCRTEEVEPGKFLRKCEKTEEILRDCVGRPTEVIQSDKEYTEEDISEQMRDGSFPLQSPEMGPFDFPGLRSDIEAIERSFLGGLSRFFDAAEEMKNGFFGAFGSLHVYDGDSSSSSSWRQGIPVEDHPQEEVSSKTGSSGEIDLSGLAKDV